VSVTNALGDVTEYAYDTCGRKTYEGGATYPVSYAYDAYGNRTEMTTYRDEDGAGDTTTWTYDEASGLVTEKVYADGHGPTYTYTADGKLATRTWARGVVTTYAYDGWGNLTSVTYSDGTPSVTYAYDAMGRQVSATDAAGTTTFAYDDYGDEARVAVSGLYSKTLVRHRDDYGRDIGHTMDGSRKNIIEYDAATGRISREQLGGAWYAWSYLPGTQLKSSLTVGTAATTTWSYEQNRDLLTQVKNTVFGNVASQYDYTNDALGRRTAKNGEQYGYNARSELVSATGCGSYSYLYDDIGNRVTSSECGTNSTYTANNLNQYTQISNVNLNLQPQPFIPQYDLDGNQTLVKTKTGTWQVSYNGENRPVSWSCGTTNVTMKFDRMGRRVEYIEREDETVLKHQKFVYDGYLCIQRLNGANNAITDLFEWDPTEPVATRPLYWQLRTPGGNYSFFYTHDGNKNVSEVVSYQSASGIVAHYDYAPFGAVRSQTGARAAANPFRFSSEFSDDTLGLVYYNYRHYEPCIGCWLNRDPFEEEGGKNLYVFCVNNPVLFVDALGNLSIMNIVNGVVQVASGAFMVKAGVGVTVGSGGLAAAGGVVLTAWGAMSIVNGVNTIMSEFGLSDNQEAVQVQIAQVITERITGEPLSREGKQHIVMAYTAADMVMSCASIKISWQAMIKEKAIYTYAVHSSKDVVVQLDKTRPASLLKLTEMSSTIHLTGTLNGTSMSNGLSIIMDYKALWVDIYEESDAIFNPEY